jgi:iron complex transport system ATP-binding protein
MNTPPRLETQDLHAGYRGRDVLHGVSLACPAGSITALIGPNGSGKSTLAKILAGILTPRSGQVRLEGRPLADWTPAARARAIGYLPQQPMCQWPLAVERLAQLGRLPHLSPWTRLGPDDLHAVDRALEEADVATLRRRPIHSLSGGEALRAHLARVLAGEPSVILADEPLAALDLRHQLEVLELFRRLAHGQGKALLVVLHDLSMAARMADRLVLLDAGRVVASGRPTEVLTEANLLRVYGVRARIAWEPAPATITPLTRHALAEDAPP